jgi:hypothetical protein
MGITAGPAAILGLSSIGSSLIGGIGSEKAAQTQADAAKQAAQLQYNLGEQGLGFQKQVYNQGQQNLAPWIQAGQGAVGNLASLIGQSQNGTGPFAPWNQQFQAPTAGQAAAYPGYQFQLQQGQQAIANSAAAAGGLLSTGTAKNLDAYSQGLAQQDYGNVYNQAFNEYLQRYNQYQTNQSNLFNRYASLAGLGQQATGQAGALGQSAANTTGNLLSTIGGQVGQNLNNIGAAQASGYAGIANAAQGPFNLASGLSLYNLLNPKAGTGSSNAGSGSGAGSSISYNPYPDYWSGESS